MPSTSHCKCLGRCYIYVVYFTDTNVTLCLKLLGFFCQTKTEAEVASEREWLEAEKVWVVHKGGFSGGRMLKSTPASPHENEALCKVKLDHGGEIVTVDEDSVEKVCTLTNGWN